MKPNRKALPLLVLLAALGLAACGDDGGQPLYIPGDEDVAERDTDIWNPGDYDPDNGCVGGDDDGDGECGSVPATGLDCTTGPCVFGQCKTGAGGGYCVCDTGYEGATCNRCAAGYEPSGLSCVLASGPCADYCLYGRCQLINGQPICECSQGYAGDRCDQCAAGYHEDTLHCIAD